MTWRLGAFRDVADPAAALTTPSPPGRDLAGDLTGIAVSASTANIGGTVWGVITTVLGFDPLDKVSQEFAGHYQVLDGLTQEWAGVSTALTGVRANLDSGRQRLPAYWKGDAASSFQDHMDQLRGAIDSQIQYAEYQRTVTQHLYEFCQDLDDDIRGILDQIVESAIELLAVAWIPVVGPARAALKATRMWEAYEEIEEDLTTLKQLIDLIVDEVHLVADVLTEPGFPRVPTMELPVRLGE